MNYARNACWCHTSPYIPAVLSAHHYVILTIAIGIVYRTNTHDRSLADQLCRTQHGGPPLVHSNETSYNLSTRERLKKRGCLCYCLLLDIDYFSLQYFFSNRETECWSYKDFYNRECRSTNDRLALFFLLAILVCDGAWLLREVARYKHGMHEVERPSLVHGVVSIFFHSTPALFFSPVYNVRVRCTGCVS